MVRLAHLLLLQIYGHLPRRARLAVVHTLAPSFTVGSICIVERADGALLLVRHSYRDRWGFPGGLLNRGEGAAAAAVREAKEECDIRIEVVGEPAVVVEPRSRRVDVIYRCTTAEAERARPIPPEVVALEWYMPNALPELQHEAAGALVALARVSRPTP